MSLSPERERVISIASDLIGSLSMHYRPENPDAGLDRSHGFDCSGFVTYVLRHAGIIIPDFIGVDNQQRPIRHTNEYWDHFGVVTHVPKPGDLVVFSRRGQFPTHIGIVYGENSYIHAPGTDNSSVELSALRTEAIKPHPQQLYTRNPIGFKALTHSMPGPSRRHHQIIID